MESQGLLLNGLPKEKESKADQKPPGEEQSRKILRQWVSHGARLKWSLCKNWLEADSVGRMLREELRARRRREDFHL